jgi:hypothetical protein
VRFGARTATAPVLIGCVFLALGLGLGERGYALLKTIPSYCLHDYRSTEVTIYFLSY